jgi:ankyrin repeat protein
MELVTDELPSRAGFLLFAIELTFSILSKDMRLIVIALICATLVSGGQEVRLAETIRAGRFEVALKLLALGADPNQADTRGRTPLMWAAAAGRIEVAAVLLDKQALVNSRFRDGSRHLQALDVAGQNRQTAMIDFLLSRGAAPSPAESWPQLSSDYREKLMRISRSVGAVQEAVWRRDSSRLEALLANSPPDARQSCLNAALWVAAASGDVPLVQKLLKQKASSVSDWDGRSALAAAAGNDRPEVVKVLLSTGIRIELIRDAVKLSGPIYPAEWFPRPVTRAEMSPEVRTALGKTAREPEAIAGALQAGDAAALNNLIQSGVYDYWVPEGPKTLRTSHLAQASKEGHQEIVRILSPSVERSPNLEGVLQRLSTSTACREQQSDDCTRISNVANWYSSQLTVAPGRPNYTRDYFLSLQSMADTLQANPKVQTVKEIADELEAKREYCVRNNVGMGGSVTVLVHTRNQQKEVPNWQVYYLLKIYEHNPDAAPGAFLKWSSPTSETIEPGRYWFWAKDPATNREAERKLVALSGAQAVSVDLFVP